MLSFYTSEWDQEPDLPWCPEQQLLRCASWGASWCGLCGLSIICWMLFEVSSVVFRRCLLVNPKSKMPTAMRTSRMVVYSRSSSLFGRKLRNMIIPTCFSQIRGFCKPERFFLFVAGRGFVGIFSCNLYRCYMLDGPRSLLLLNFA